MPGRVTQLLSAVIAVGLVALPAPRADGGPGTGGAGGSGSNDSGTITAGVTVVTGGTGSGGSGCSWERVEGEIGVPGLGVGQVPFVNEEGVTVNLWKVTCGARVEWYLIPETDPEDLLPRLLEQIKSTRLPDPEPTFFALDPVNNWAYVTVPLDFRAGGDAWRPVSVTASLGPVWATVTAEPVSLTFDPGDPNGPGAVVCTGDSPIAGYDPAVPGECSYTYVNASSTSPYDGYHFQTTTSIEWSISWTSSTGAGGALDPYSTSSTELLAVAEVKGLVTCTGSRAEQGGC